VSGALVLDPDDARPRLAERPELRRFDEQRVHVADGRASSLPYTKTSFEALGAVWDKRIPMRGYVSSAEV
jgi:hypothetical protein